jgi:hypothetical protein
MTAALQKGPFVLPEGERQKRVETVRKQVRYLGEFTDVPDDSTSDRIGTVAKESSASLSIEATRRLFLCSYRFD